MTTESCWRIVVGSGKGGVGKSVISILLAALAAGRARRVLLVDGAQNLANLHVLLGVRAGASLGSLLENEIRVEDLLQEVAPGLWLLPAESGAEALYSLDPIQRARISRRLSRLYHDFDVVIVDAEAGIESVIRAASLGASRVLLLTVPEPPALMDAYAVIKLLAARLPQLPVDILVNRCLDDVEGQEAFQRLATTAEHLLGSRLTLGGVLLEESVVGAAVRNPGSCLSRLLSTQAASRLQKAPLLDRLAQPERTGGIA